MYILWNVYVEYVIHVGRGGANLKSFFYNLCPIHNTIKYVEQFRSNTCKACNADVWNLIPSNRSFVRDLTILWKESFGISKLVVLWYLLISKRALELGLQFRGSFIPPVSLDCSWSLCKALKVLEILTIVSPLGARWLGFLWTCFIRAIWRTHLSSARRKQKVELFFIGGPKKIHFRDKQRARCQTVCSIFGIVMEKEIQSLRLQLEQIDQENKRLRDLLVNMSKDNSVVKSTYVQYNYSYNAPIDMIEETRILILVRPRAVLTRAWTMDSRWQTPVLWTGVCSW